MKAQEALNVLNNTKFSVSNEAEEQKCKVYQAAFKTAIEALEKQIPKKPAVFEGYSQGRYTVAFCPNCKKLLGLLSFAKNSCKHCCECGQALDWSDTE